jgi:hypothetical protein
MDRRNHFVVSAIHVNPLTIIWLDQMIHRTDGSLAAIPSKPDLIWYLTALGYLTDRDFDPAV